MRRCAGRFRGLVYIDRCLPDLLGGRSDLLSWERPFLYTARAIMVLITSSTEIARSPEQAKEVASRLHITRQQ